MIWQGLKFRYAYYGLRLGKPSAGQKSARSDQGNLSVSCRPLCSVIFVIRQTKMAMTGSTWLTIPFLRFTRINIVGKSLRRLDHLVDFSLFCTMEKTLVTSFIFILFFFFFFFFLFFFFFAGQSPSERGFNLKRKNGQPLLKRGLH